MSQLLQDQLDAITTRTRKLVQPERLAISETAAEELFASGIEQRLLPAGSSAPAFSLQDAATGKLVRSTDLLALGPVILNFFRGRWCPYCVTELEAWQRYYGQVRERGALFVAISPQTARQNDFTIQQHELPFPVLSDPESKVAEAFGVAYTVPESQRSYFRSILVNIPFANSNLSYDKAPEWAWRLPMPATILLLPDGATGRIAFAEAHADFRVRPEPAEILALL